MTNNSTLILESAYDKKLIPSLERVKFDGRIVVVINEHELENAIKYLMQQPIIGLDTETKPNFSKKQHNKVSLLQVSSHDICFLFRLNFIGFPKSLQNLLTSDYPLKVGLSFKDDIRMLQEWETFKMGKYVELQQLATQFGIIDKSLQKLYANVFHKCISKRQQLSNWEAPILTEAQKVYAATDAWACVQLYEKFQQLKRDHNYTVRSEVSPEELMEKQLRESFNEFTQQAI